MRVRTGTSGYSYKEWKGSFYPEDIRASDMLRHYASRLSTVEINNTFYRMPTEKLLAGWAEQAPEGFRFVLKAPQRITHRKRLEDAGEEVSHLLEISSVLADKLGPTLYQLPPFFKKDLPRLRDFLALLRRDRPSAFEFRHASWFDEETYGALREHGAALVVADTDEGGDGPLVPTAGFGYLRLRRKDYPDESLRAWAERVLAQPWQEAYVFFKHEDAGTGPRLAGCFAEIASAGQ